MDEASRYRVLKICANSSMRSAIDFVEELRRRLPVAVRPIRTDHGSEFGTESTRHLHDLGIAHRHIARGSPENIGKVERSHRTDEEEYYRRVIFRPLEDFQHKLQWGSMSPITSGAPWPLKARPQQFARVSSVTARVSVSGKRLECDIGY